MLGNRKACFYLIVIHICKTTERVTETYQVKSCSNYSVSLYYSLDIFAQFIKTFDIQRYRLKNINLNQ